MSTRHLVDPDLLPFLDVFPSVDATAEKLAGLREMMRSLVQVSLDPSQVRHATAQDGHAVRLVLYRPPADPVDHRATVGAILHIHGGGFVLGSPEISHVRNEELAATLGVLVVSVDYRLAPENPHPIPVEDCYAALHWLYRNAAELGVDLARVALMGESAGGGLAAALALMARDRGEFPLAFQLLVYPMLDDRTATSVTQNPHVGEFIWTRRSNHFGWQALLGRAPGSPKLPAYASPARHKQLEGLPPAFLSTGSLDLFLDEDIDYAQRLARAGVPIELHVYPGAFHGFDGATDAEVAKAMKRDVVNALRRALKAEIAPLRRKAPRTTDATENAHDG